MAITLRTGLGRKLTIAEMDENFTFLSGSYVVNSVTSSMTVATASIADELSGLATASIADSATTASQADNATSASIADLAIIGSGSFSGSFEGNGSGLTGLSSYTVANSADNRVLTSVDASNGNAEANLTFDGSTLTVAGSISETSALRYKENIQPLNNSLNKVIKLNPVEYDRKQDGKHDIGLIAEEVNKIYPDLVSKQGTQVHGISYSKLTATLIGAIKDLNNRIEELEVQISTSNK
jgi:hypothetical protein